MAWWNRRRGIRSRTASVQALADEGTQRLLRSRLTAQAWQDQARHYARIQGVVRFAFGLLADSAARSPIVGEYLVDPARDRWEPTDDPDVARILQSYRNERDDTPELIRRHVWRYCVDGEMYQTVEDGAGDPEWHIWAPPAVEVRGGMRPVLVKELPGGSMTGGGAREVPVEQTRRFWRPDDDWPLLATSPMLGALDDCERYHILGRRLRRDAQSSLGLNGILWTPSTAHTYQLGPDGQPAKLSRLDSDLVDVAERNWIDDDSVAAVAPFSVSYGDDNATPPTWIKVGSALDSAIFEAREEALGCIARDVNLPQKLVIGQGDENHWTGWLLQEDFVRSSLSPLLERVHWGDLTAAMLRPTLMSLLSTGQWAGDPSRWRVGFDTVPIVVHPDRAERAFQLFGAGAIGPLSLLAETGFGAEDAPTPDELQAMIDFRRFSSPLSLSFESRSTPVGPATTRELPPAAAALAPYQSELGGWLDS